MSSSDAVFLAPNSLVSKAFSKVTTFTTLRLTKSMSCLLFTEDGEVGGFVVTIRAVRPRLVLSSCPPANNGAKRKKTLYNSPEILSTHVDSIEVVEEGNNDGLFLGG